MTGFPDENELMRVLAATLMQIMKRYDSVRVPRDSVSGAPEDERFAVQIDVHNSDHYTVRVVKLTDKQRRENSGRTEEALLARVPEGWSVKVWHGRRTENGLLMSKYRARQLRYALASRGGYTEVELTSPNGNFSYFGEAICSLKDNFCRAEGRVIALDRAVRKMENAIGLEQDLHRVFSEAITDAEMRNQDSGM